MQPQSPWGSFRRPRLGCLWTEAGAPGPQQVDVTFPSVLVPSLPCSEALRGRHARGKTKGHARYCVELRVRECAPGPFPRASSLQANRAAIPPYAEVVAWELDWSFIRLYRRPERQWHPPDVPFDAADVRFWTP